MEDFVPVQCKLRWLLLLFAACDAVIKSFVLFTGSTRLGGAATVNDGERTGWQHCAYIDNSAPHCMRNDKRHELLLQWQINLLPINWLPAFSCSPVRIRYITLSVCINNFSSWARGYSDTNHWCRTRCIFCHNCCQRVENCDAHVQTGPNIKSTISPLDDKFEKFVGFRELFTRQLCTVCVLNDGRYLCWTRTSTLFNDISNTFQMKMVWTEVTRSVR